MAYSFDKNDNSIVINGFERGISPSPDLGIADLKCANISTLTGEAMVNFSRYQQNEKYSASMSGTLTATNGIPLLTYAFTANPTSIAFLQPGSWITISASTITGLSNGNYFINFSSNILAQITLSATYDNTGGLSTITPSSNGTATFTFVQNTASLGGIMTKPVASATEIYFDLNITQQSRYYIMDTEGHVWVYDTAVTNEGSNYWALIDTQTARNAVYGGGSTEQATGLAVYNGYLIIFIGELTAYKLTSILGMNLRSPSSSGWATSSVFGVYGSTNYILNSQRGSLTPHFTYNSNSGKLFWTDNSYIGALFFGYTAIAAGLASTLSIFSYAQVTASSSSGLLLTVNAAISGSIPLTNMPITFYTSGTLPGGINADVIYYILTPALSSASTTFKVSTTPNGTPVTFTGAGTGNLYYNTMDLNNNGTFNFQSQSLLLPIQKDKSQCIIEIGSQVLIGTNSNTLYLWDGNQSTVSSYIFLPEGNTVNMINANNMGYIFSGSRGNIYITNGSTSSLVVTVPDYVTGVPDPYFTWGGAMYAKGRIWFSVEDQNSSKTGNCGGIWSFVPTQNLFIGQDTGLALRLEHQNSYGTYNGVANLLINQVNQNFQGLPYFSAWTSSVSSPSYGIDNSNTVPYVGGQTLIETDLVPIGNYLDKGNFTSVVTKYDAPLVSGEQVQVLYRNDILSAFLPLSGPLGGIDNIVGSLGNRFEIPFANAVHVQFRIILTSTATNPSFVRFRELRVRK